MRIRWAYEEIGQPYAVRLVSFDQLRQPHHLALNPFGQIPTMEDGAVRLFESGAILLHVASKGPGLLPEDPVARARAIMWLFAALNTVEPPLIELEQATFHERDASWFPERRIMLCDRIRVRFEQLARWLGEADWLESTFTLGDLAMVHVLRRSEGMGILEDYPNLVAYVARATARPAYLRAFQDQFAVFANRP